MISRPTMNLQGARLTPISPKSEPNSKPPSPATLTPTASESHGERQPRKLKGSSQLNRWSRARAIKSGHKLDRSMHRPTRTVEPVHRPADIYPTEDSSVSGKIDGGDETEATGGKSIYMVSDGTGWTAEHSVHAALGQFDYCLVDRGCPVNTHLFSGVEDEEQLMEVVKQAAREGALLLYTLADPSMAESARRACKIWGVPSTDILGPITEAIATHLGVSPSGLPRGAAGRPKTLNEDYFRRIEAIEFTVKQDDGTLPENLHKADLILVGVSRTGKTPLSTYLAQKGYKVANVPIVLGAQLPRSLFEVDGRKVFGLTINPMVLQAIRKARAKTLGIGAQGRSNYSDMDFVRKELEYAGRIFTQNPSWPVIEVTNKAIEETAAVVLRLYHDGSQSTSMPHISKRY